MADPDKLTLHCPESNRIYADRVGQNVPIFKSEFTFTHAMSGEVVEKAPPDSDPLIAELARVPVHPKRAEAAEA